MEPLKKANANYTADCIDRRYEYIPVDEWGVVVTLRSLTEDEYHNFRDECIKNSKVDERILRATLLSWCIVDPDDGSRLFSANQLAGKSSHALAVLFRVAARLCGMDDDDIGEILKNSASARPDVSS